MFDTVSLKSVDNEKFMDKNLYLNGHIDMR